MTPNDLVKIATDVACKLHRERGISYDEACQRATRALVAEVKSRGGLAGFGQADILAQAAALEPVKAIRETVSPWLWVASLAGLAMAIVNTRRIAKMFRGWKAEQAL